MDLQDTPRHGYVGTREQDERGQQGRPGSFDPGQCRRCGIVARVYTPGENRHGDPKKGIYQSESRPD